ncbi:ribonuclease HI family protein [candidate division KSB1 bacterium]
MDEKKLLQQIYKNINFNKLLGQNPGVSKKDVDHLFKKIDELLPDSYQEKRTTLDDIHLYIDGAARGNPGHAAIGCVLKDPDGNVLHEESKYIGKTTNNVAEYTGLIHGLEILRHFAPPGVKIFSDSELLVKQINGEYKTKNPNLLKLKEKAESILVDFKEYSIEHIPREKNSLADGLANKALDKKLKFKK